MKIKKGDTVLMVSGKDRLKKGKVLKSAPKTNQILVEGVNLKKKHQRPKKGGEKGQIISLPSFIAASAAKLICPKCGKATRIGYRIAGEKKFRVCKKCGQEID